MAGLAPPPGAAARQDRHPRRRGGSRRPAGPHRARGAHARPGAAGGPAFRRPSQGIRRMTDPALEAARDWIGRGRTAAGLITAAPADILAATFDRDDPPLAAGDADPARLALVLFPGGGETLRDRPGRPCGQGRLHAGGTAAAPDVGRSRDDLRTAAAGRTGGPARLDHRRRDPQEWPGRAAVLRHRPPRDLRPPTGWRRWRTTTPSIGARRRPPARPRRRAPTSRRPRRSGGAEIRPDPVLLFRYSALTMNSHRIHYDRDYVTGVEGYPGLLVHGNLVATLLLDLFRRALPAVRLETFAVRALSPLYDTAALHARRRAGPGARDREAVGRIIDRRDRPIGRGHFPGLAASAARPSRAGSGRVMT